MRPNILWYCTDQQRYDTIRALGNPYIQTPTIDALSRRGMAFTHAFAQSAVCTPSRATFLTGRYPASHHVHRNGTARFPSHETLVTKLFADAGYHCGLVGKLHLAAALVDREPRTDDGYSFFAWSHHPYPGRPRENAYLDWLAGERGIVAADLFRDAPGLCGAGVPADVHQTHWATDVALRFVDAADDRSWLLSVNVFDPHPPFDPPANYLARVRKRALPPPAFRESDLVRQQRFAAIPQQSMHASRPMTGSERPPREPVGNDLLRWAHRPPERFHGGDVKAAYYAMIELIDDELGRLLRGLAERGQLERTLVVFMSDHGEMLGDHGLLYKGCRFFEPLLRVPLIFAGPGVSPAHPCASLVELVDVAPTLLELADIDVPQRMQGRSLAPLLRGESPPHRDHVVAEYNDALGSTPLQTPVHASMYRDARHKLVVYHGHDLGELYDLERDPGEFDDLWDEPTAARLKCELVRRHFDAMMATSDAGIPRASMG